MLETLFPYQETGAEWLSTVNSALLADEMGLGKSAQVVRACDLIGAKDILVVCPAAVRINWDREFGRFSPMDRPSNILMTGKDRSKPGVNIVSYDLIGGNEKVRNDLRARQWNVLVLDECHYLKERSTQRTKACYGANSKSLGLIHSAERVWRLSGTPMPNDASELWTHLKSMGVVNIPYWDFVFEFCDGFQGDYGYKITGHKNTNKLRRLMAPTMLRRKKFDVLSQLPPIVFQNVTVERSEVELDPWFYENYITIGVPKFLENMKNLDQGLRNSLEIVKEGRASTHEDALKVLESFSKSTATLRRYIGLAKLPRVLDIIEEELESGAIKKIVLFAHHQQVIEQARKRLIKFKPVTLFGGTPGIKRQMNIDKFQNEKHCRVFIGQILAAGTGITLTAASEVAFLETDWVPANNAQAAMRCHRIGQTKPVRVRFFTCAGSVDEDVMRAVVHKTREITKIID